jgi:hypothetical protein
MSIHRPAEARTAADDEEAEPDDKEARSHSDQDAIAHSVHFLFTLSALLSLLSLLSLSCALHHHRLTCLTCLTRWTDRFSVAAFSSQR